MSKKYVIRGYHWGYNDEIYYPCGSFIKSSFDEKEEAERALIQLERAHWKEMNLGETDTFFDGSAELIKKLESFISEKLNIDWPVAGEYHDIFLPQELSDDDFLKFLKLADLQAYKLTFFEDNPEFFAVWVVGDEDYLKEFDECSVALVYSDSLDRLKVEAKDHLKYMWRDKENTITGKIEEISHHPQLLESLISTSESVKYNAKGKRIKVKTSDKNAIFSVNELLKSPIFEVRKLSLEEVQAIEADLGDEEW